MLSYVCASVSSDTSVTPAINICTYYIGHNILYIGFHYRSTASGSSAAYIGYIGFIHCINYIRFICCIDYASFVRYIRLMYL